MDYSRCGQCNECDHIFQYRWSQFGGSWEYEEYCPNCGSPLYVIGFIKRFRVVIAKRESIEDGYILAPYQKKIDACGDKPSVSNLDGLAEAQGVKPLKDIKKLFGTWPGDRDDGFEAAINDLRHANHD